MRIISSNDDDESIGIEVFFHLKSTDSFQKPSKKTPRGLLQRWLEFGVQNILADHHRYMRNPLYLGYLEFKITVNLA